MTKFVLLVVLICIVLAPVVATEIRPGVYIPTHEDWLQDQNNQLSHTNTLLKSNLTKAVKLLLEDTIHDKTLTTDIDAREKYASSTNSIEAYNYSYKVLVNDGWKIVSKEEYKLFIKSEQEQQRQRIADMKILLDILETE